MFVCFHRSALLWEAGGGPEEEEVGGAGSEQGGREKKERQKKKEGLKPESAAFPSLSFPLPRHKSPQADGADATTREKCQLSDSG